jgi:hypothetical protein
MRVNPSKISRRARLLPFAAFGGDGLPSISTRIVPP